MSEQYRVLPNQRGRWVSRDTELRWFEVEAVDGGRGRVFMPFYSGRPVHEVQIHKGRGRGMWTVRRDGFSSMKVENQSEAVHYGQIAVWGALMLSKPTPTEYSQQREE